MFCVLLKILFIKIKVNLNLQNLTKNKIPEGKDSPVGRNLFVFTPLQCPPHSKSQQMFAGWLDSLTDSVDIG